MDVFRVVCIGALAVQLMGCPSSDDLLEVPDSGLGPQDILLDGGQTTGGPDTETVSVDSQPNPDQEEMTEGCQSSTQCAGVFPSLTSCEIAECNLATGQCVVSEAPEGATCDDGDSCTVTECLGGVCVVSTEVPCDDGNECTVDLCNAESGCQFINKITPCDDGDPCTEGDLCDEGICKPGAPSPACGLGTQENPGVSCKELMQAEPSLEDGVYWLKPNDTAGTFKTWCHFSSSGGGWTRVASVRGDIPVCSYVEGAGTSTDLVSTGPTTGILAIAQAGSIPFGGELLVRVSGTDYQYLSADPSWSWTAVASGEINSQNVAVFEVQTAVNGLDTGLVGYTSACISSGACLLGGTHDGTSDWGVVLGIGAYCTGTHKQDDTCLSKSSLKGLFAGPVAGGGGWGSAGEIYIR